jgi:hypothetical protein
MINRQIDQEMFGSLLNVHQGAFKEEQLTEHPTIFVKFAGQESGAGKKPGRGHIFLLVAPVVMMQHFDFHLY